MSRPVPSHWTTSHGFSPRPRPCFQIGHPGDSVFVREHPLSRLFPLRLSSPRTVLWPANMLSTLRVSSSACVSSRWPCVCVSPSVCQRWGSRQRFSAPLGVVGTQGLPAASSRILAPLCPYLSALVPTTEQGLEPPPPSRPRAERSGQCGETLLPACPVPVCDARR